MSGRKNMDPGLAALCEATGDHNGVVDAYKEDVLGLPPWDGTARHGREE